MERRAFVIGNAIGYQGVWLASVLGAAQGRDWTGPAAAAVFAAFTLAFGGRFREDLRLAVVAVPLGWLLDSAFAYAGGLEHAGAAILPGMAPAWIATLWLAFALTLNHSLAFLQGRPRWSAALGGLGGPLAYVSAAGIGAVALAEPSQPTLAALAVCWALLLPLLTSRRGGLPLALDAGALR